MSEWVFIPLDDERRIIRAIRTGHGHPYITVKNGKHCLALAHPCNRDAQHTAQEVVHVIEHYESNSDVCTLHVVFDKDCIAKLQKLPEEGIVCDTKVCEQRELAGIFNLKQIVDGVCILDIDHTTVVSGMKEAVDVPRAMYTFHTHPRQAYRRHRVTKGWPSVHDFVGVLSFGKEMIFHAVATIEGLYIIALCPLSKLPPKEFVDKHFDFSHHAKYDEYEYTRRVEAIKYKGDQVFNIKYIPWEHCHSIIAVPYAKQRGVCNPVPDTREKVQSTLFKQA